MNSQYNPVLNLFWIIEKRCLCCLTFASVGVDGELISKSVYTREYEIFLRLLRQARQNAGINQREVAERMHESTLFVSRCERGERRMDPIELLSYCQAIEQPATEFMRQLEEAVKGG